MTETLIPDDAPYLILKAGYVFGRYVWIPYCRQCGTKARRDRSTSMKRHPLEWYWCAGCGLICSTCKCPKATTVPQPTNIMSDPFFQALKESSDLAPERKEFYQGLVNKARKQTKGIKSSQDNDVGE